jgi:hypothetical protein
MRVTLKFEKKWHRFFSRLSSLSIAIGIMSVVNHILGTTNLGLSFKIDYVIGKVIVNLIFFPLIFYVPIWISKLMSSNGVNSPKVVAPIPDKKVIANSSNVGSINHQSNDDEHWLRATSEIENGDVNKVLWAKLFAQADGDEAKTKARYLVNRVEELKASVVADKEIKESTDRNNNFSKEIANIDKNSPDKNLEIGMAIYNGTSVVDSDHSQAFEFIHKAAVNGNHDAQFNLSLMYWKGDGVKKDKAKAYAWCRIASGFVADAKENVKFFSKDVSTTEVFESDRLIKEFLKIIDDNSKGLKVTSEEVKSSQPIQSPNVKKGTVDYSKLSVDDCMSENLYDEYMLGEFKCYELFNGKAMVVTESRKLVYRNIHALRNALETFKRSGVFTMDNLVQETRLKS